MAIITKKTESPIAWGEIKEAVKAGKAAEILHVGDEIAETLTTGEQVVFVVAGIGVYAENQVIFSLKNCLAEEYRMNEDWTNKGGWPACDMRRHLAEDVFPVLPDDLKAVITPRKLTTDDGEAEDNIWLFSEYEVFGEDWCDKDPGDKPIPYYQTPANRVKCDADGDTTWWWERSPYAGYSTFFCGVASGGVAGNTNASYSSGVCFGFCI